MVENRIILYDGKKEIAEAEEALTARRTKIVEALEVCRSAMEKFLERPIDFEDLEPFLKSANEDDRKEKAIKLWLSKTRQVVPALKVKLTSAIITPKEVIDLLEPFAEYLKDKSEDSKRYWEEKSKVFAVIPVGKEDRDIIIERCRVYCPHGVDPELGKFAYQYVQIINYGNKFFSRYGGGSGPIEDNPDTFPHFLKPLLMGRHIPVNEHGGIIWEFALKPGLFTQNGIFKTAFDERIHVKGGSVYRPLSLKRGVEKDERFNTHWVD